MVSDDFMRSGFGASATRPGADVSPARGRPGPAWLVAAACLAAGGPVVAQDGAWTFAASPYLWAPGAGSSVETRFGRLDADASIGDVLSAVDVALMGVFEARRGRLGLIADLVYADLTERNDTPFGVLFSHARVESELTLASGYAAYRLHEDDRVAVDALGGFRAVSVDLAVTLEPRLLERQRFDVSGDWIDPLVGARVQVALADRWSATAFGDIGGFGGDTDLTWQAFASLSYRINDRWSAQGGWRQLHIEHRIEGRDVTLELGGPLLGATFRF
jgi:opacity protein-like surface antigen